MNLYTSYTAYMLLLLWIWCSPLCTTDIAAKEFVVVIDPGHGGHDPGAIGKTSKEKDINLKVSLKLGNLIKHNCADVKVIYTRNKDVFIPLNKRAEIANNAKADLFISIHTNALAKNKTMMGASTWTLGLAKSEANLDVAKRENSVILYEEDYQSSYAGFDPNSSESYIIFEFLQDKYMSQSVHFASIIQQKFKSSSKRIDRGVHQAGFLVLKASAMPSVLVELGFISTPEEERYLNSETGQENLSLGIFQAFLQYKKEHQLRTEGGDISDAAVQEPSVTPSSPDSNSHQQAENTVKPTRKNTVQATPASKKENMNATGGNPVFKVQIMASPKLLNLNSQSFKGLKGVEHYKEKGLYKYTYGATENYNEALRIKNGIKAKFPDAFIIAFKDGEKTDVNAAIAAFKKR